MLASTLGDSASRLFGVIEAVGGFLAILLIIFFVAGRVTGRFEKPLTIALCLGPALVLVIIGLVVPAVTTFVTSLRNQQFLGQRDSKYVGLQNYRFDFTDPATQGDAAAHPAVVADRARVRGDRGAGWSRCWSTG